MTEPDLIRLYGFLAIANVWCASVKELGLFCRLLFGCLALAPALFLLFFSPAAHSDDGVSNDGIVAVLTAPIDAAIDAAFAAIGYSNGDSDE